jgi:hypothetical protein
MSWLRAVAYVALCATLAGRASAQDTTTVPPAGAEAAPSDVPGARGEQVVNAEGGYPGMFVEYLSGMSPRFDLGAKFTFNYGLEGDIQKYAPGIKLQALLFFVLPPIGPITPSVRVDPGLYSYFFGQAPSVGPLRSGPGPAPLALSAPRIPRGATRQALPPYYGSTSSGDEGPSYYGTLYGTVIPVTYQIDFPVDAQWKGRAAIGAAPNITFGNGNGGFVLPLQVGVGVSYALQRDLDLRVDYAVGPRIYFGSGTNLAIEAYVGVGWHP